MQSGNKAEVGVPRTKALQELKKSKSTEEMGKK